MLDRLFSFYSYCNYIIILIILFYSSTTRIMILHYTLNINLSKQDLRNLTFAIQAERLRRLTQCRRVFR